MIGLIIIMMLGVMLTIGHLIIVENIRQIEPKPWNIREIMILWAKSMFKTFWEDFPSSKKHHNPPPPPRDSEELMIEKLRWFGLSLNNFLGHWIHKWSSQNQPLLSFKSFWGSASLRHTSTYRHTYENSCRPQYSLFWSSPGEGRCLVSMWLFGDAKHWNFCTIYPEITKGRIDKIRLIMV